MAVSPWDADGDATAGEVPAADVCAAQPGADAAWKGAKDAGGALRPAAGQDRAQGVAAVFRPKGHQGPDCLFVQREPGGGP